MKNSSSLMYFSYGIFSLPLSWLTISLFVFLPKFYIEQGILSFSVLAKLAIGFRVLDAALDILIGRKIEKSKDSLLSHVKRIRLMAIPLGLATLILFAPGYILPYLYSSSSILILNGIFFLVFLTTVQISYDSIIPNLVSSYYERSKLLSYRSGAILLGSLLAPVVPFILSQYYSKQVSFLLIGLILLMSLNLLSQINARLITYSDRVVKVKHMDAFFPRIASLLKEAPVRNLLISLALSAAGATLPAALILFYVEYIIGSTRGPIFVAVYLLVAAMSLPLWTWISKYLEKNSCWIYGIIINAGALLYIFTLGKGDEWQYACAVFISAIGYGSTILFPASMQADVVDYDHWRFGKRRESEIASLCLFTKKTAAALALGLSFYFLGQEQSGSAPVLADGEGLYALRALYSLVPAILSSLAVIWVSRYRLTEEDLKRLQSELL